MTEVMSLSALYGPTDDEVREFIADWHELMSKHEKLVLGAEVYIETPLGWAKIVVNRSTDA